MKNSIAEAKKYYGTIGKVWCPVLKDYIIFNSIGFRHLIRSGRRRRSNADRARRFRLLRLAVEMIENPGAKIMHPDGDISSAELWIITEKRSKDIITLIIRQMGTGAKHFFSIYN